MKINIQFSVLSQYILEMPETIPNLENPKINRKVLQEYYDSLQILMKVYVDNQPTPSKLV
jgi:hypothetical protein